MSKNMKQVGWEIKNQLGIEPERQEEIVEEISHMMQGPKSLGEIIVAVWQTDLIEREKLLVLGLLAHKHGRGFVIGRVYDAVEGLLEVEEG